MGHITSVMVLKTNHNVNGRVCLTATWAGKFLTWILWEANGEGRVKDFLLEEIFLVEEEDNGGIAKPLVVTDRIKQF